MKVLFDEDVPHKLLRYLFGHEIHTVIGMQWGGFKNGALLALIERERFDVFLTGDKNMDQQRRLEGRPFAVLIMSAINWPVVRPHIHKIRSPWRRRNPVRSARLIAACSLHLPNAHRPKPSSAVPHSTRVAEATPAK